MNTRIQPCCAGSPYFVLLLSLRAGGVGLNLQVVKVPTTNNKQIPFKTGG